MASREREQMSDKRQCEWPDCDERQTGLMRYCTHHAHMVLMGHGPETE